MYEKSWTILMSYDIDSAGRMGVENNVPYLASCKGVGTNDVLFRVELRAITLRCFLTPVSTAMLTGNSDIAILSICLSVRLSRSFRYLRVETA